jgi:hypothetical protein
LTLLKKVERQYLKINPLSQTKFTAPACSAIIFFSLYLKVGHFHGSLLRYSEKKIIAEHAGAVNLV